MGKLNETKIWTSVEDLTQDAKFKAMQAQEFVELPIVGNEEKSEGEMQTGTNRRDFLKYVGFGLGAATIASCEIPVKKAIPYIVKPEQIIPGVANFYASAFVSGGDFASVLVKAREGRPIKIEGNELCPITAGGTSARVQASVLSLYDSNRFAGASKIADKKSTDISWDDLDKAVVGALNANAEIRIVSHTTISPTLLAAIADFKTAFPKTKHVQYDPFSVSALLDANAAMFGKRLVPNYNFAAAKAVVGIEADFLGTWISPIEYAKDYIKNRKVTDADIKTATQKMSVHIQFESRMSLTGSNADNRLLLKPSEQGTAIVALYNAIATKTGKATLSGGTAEYGWAKAQKAINATAETLLANQNKALVVCGINDINIQMLVNGINEMLGAYGNTILWQGASLQRQGNDTELTTLITEMSSGSVAAVFVLDANPAFDIAGLATKFAEALPKVALSVALNSSMDETAELCKWAAPDHHYLEAWGDAQPKAGHYYLVQPTIKPLFKTRAAGLSFLTWTSQAPAGDNAYYDYLVAYWQNAIFPSQQEFASKQAFWDNSLHQGFTVIKQIAETAPVSTTDLSAAAGKITAPSKDMEVSFYETINMGSGQYANNPWLQEMPDPVMRTTWDNFISIPIKWNGDNDYTVMNDLIDGDMVSVTIGGVNYELPVVRQFGQLENTVAIGLGYGRRRAGKAGTAVGKDLFPVVANFQFHGVTTAPTKTGHDKLFAPTQIHHTYGLNTTDADGKIKYDDHTDKPFNVDEQVLGHRGFQGSLTERSVFFQTTAKDLSASIEELKEKRKEYQHLNSKGLYPDYKDVYGAGHHWAMSVDLNSCIGCGACTVACMAENNVPVVGKYEYSLFHDMAWLRIDRYFYGAEDTPNAAYMPMLCQHCDNAPCENVCPVAATNHSSEGLNQMTYNRCIGTRYCANNCPFKVRRFNWLDYTTADLFPANEVDLNRGKKDGEYMPYYSDNLVRMVLNPDVTVRSRGVIEKCSFCVQRLQEGKLKAKVEGRKLKDNQDIKVACQQACPTGAIVFGDRNDKKSVVAQWIKSERTYIPLEETNVRSSVFYTMKVINRNENINGSMEAPTQKAEEHSHS
jgi:molybdopterin-containing oxidoreductase family iron-sulfur binding subunit